MSDLKEKFREEDNKTIKVAELKKVEQESKTMEEFVQEFRRIIRNSRYEKRSLIKEFKKRTNRMIRKKLIEEKRPPRGINQ